MNPAHAPFPVPVFARLAGGLFTNPLLIDVQ